jgi:hypothetical protein
MVSGQIMRGTFRALTSAMQMTTTSVHHSGRRRAHAPLFAVLWLACIVPTAADAPERDTRTWTEGKVSVTFSTPETYGSCRPRDLTDEVYTVGVPTSWRLAGRINVGFVREGVFTILRVVPVDTHGDLALTIEYPPHTELLPHAHGVLEYHAEPQIEVFDDRGRKSHFIGGDLERAPGTLGPGGQDWDIFCATTTTGSR